MKESGNNVLRESVEREIAQIVRGDGKEAQEHHDRVYLSIVIPTFNERARLPNTLIKTVQWCFANMLAWEIIVSDDGSSDETVEIVRLFSNTFDNVTVIPNAHKGKGAAVRAGVLGCRGRFVLFMDADGATPMDETKKLLAALEGGFDVAVGSRVADQNGAHFVRMSFFRKLAGKVFSIVVRVFAVKGIKDTQCGFKMFSDRAAGDLFGKQKLDGFAFDVELLYLAKKSSYRVAEIPVNWFDQKGSKVNMYSDSLKMVKDILKVRLLHAFGSN